MNGWQDLKRVRTTGTLNNLISEVKGKLRIEQVIDEYTPLNKNNKARCPFHEDHQPSLAVYPATQSFYCFGCGKGGDIIDFISEYKKQDFQTSLKELAYRAGISTSANYSEKDTTIEGEQKKLVEAMELLQQVDRNNQPIATYTYFDHAGRLAYEILRYPDKKFAIRHQSNGRWVYKQPERLYPYNLPKVIQADEVWIVEGEKDADRLIENGLVATTNPFGAGKWRSEYNQWLKGKDVVVLMDADKPGRDHGKRVVDSLLPIAKSVKAVDLFEEANDGRDVCDFLDKYSIENLKKFVESLPAQSRNDGLLRSLFTWNTVKELDTQVDYIVEGLLPRQAITLLFGKGGVGKTWLVLALGKSVSLGEPFNDLATIKTPTIFIDFENPLPLLKRRIELIGGESDNFYIWHFACESPPPKLDTIDWIRYFDLPDDALLIFDTLRSVHNLDENSSQDMTLIMDRLKTLRERGYTILLLHHTPKTDEGIFKGSTAIADLSDHILGLEKIERGAHAFDLDAVYRLGVRNKSRYAPFECFLAFDPGEGFMSVENPDIVKLKGIRELLQTFTPRNQKELVKYINETCGYSHNKIRELLKKGEGTYWRVNGDRLTGFVYEVV